MRLDRIDLNLFVVFDTIYTERNLTRAAELLCLSQPAVSNALSRLRKTLNDDLFVRTPKGMIPTPMADKIVVRVRESLSLITETISDCEQFDPLQSARTFRFSMTDFAQSLLLPDLMAQLQAEAPNMTINNYYLPRQEQGRAMAAGQLDLAIDAPLQKDSQLRHKPLLSGNYVCIFGDKHPNRNKPLTLERYLQLKHLHISSREQGIGQVDAALHKMSLTRQVRLRVANYLVVPRILASSELVSTVPAALARQLNLPTLPLPFDVPPLKLHLYWHKNADRDPASQWLREVLDRLSVLE
jgi:DNA-binding transcriptional LysR family regulator